MSSNRFGRASSATRVTRLPTITFFSVSDRGRGGYAGKAVDGWLSLLISWGVSAAGVRDWLCLSLRNRASSLAWHDGQSGIV